MCVNGGILKGTFKVTHMVSYYSVRFFASICLCYRISASACSWSFPTRQDICSNRTVTWILFSLAQGKRSLKFFCQLVVLPVQTYLSHCQPYVKLQGSALHKTQHGTSAAFGFWVRISLRFWQCSWNYRTWSQNSPFDVQIL